MYDTQSREHKMLLRFGRADPIVSHVKLTKDSKNNIMLVYVQAGRCIKTYNITTLTHRLVAVMPDSILALHVR